MLSSPTLILLGCCLSFSYFASACSGGSGSALDLVFLIDGSKSVRPENFELVKKFINQIVESLEVSEKQAQVGLVQYSSSVRQEFPLGQFKNKKDIKAAVKKMAYMEKGTMTGQALKYLVDNSFSIANGARPGVPKVGIVFTDGRSQDYITDAAKKAKDLGRSTELPFISLLDQSLHLLSVVQCKYTEICPFADLLLRVISQSSAITALNGCSPCE